MEDYKKNNNEDQSKKASKGYKIVILLLVVILAVISFVYFRQTSQLKKEYQTEKDNLTGQLNTIRSDFDNLHGEYDVVNSNLERQSFRADSLLEKLQNERTMNLATVRKYDKELATMRTIMKRYVTQIDSLNQVNRTLTEENVNIRRQATSERLRAEAAEEKANELDLMVRKGAVVRAREVMLYALNANDRSVRAARAERLRVDFILGANDLTVPGQRNIYARITGPDGYVLAGDTDSLFDFEGDKITYSAVRQIDYQNEDLAVGLYYNGSGIVSGTYYVEIFMDGVKVGEGETILK